MPGHADVGLASQRVVSRVDTLQRRRLGDVFDFPRVGHRWFHPSAVMRPANDITLANHHATVAENSNHYYFEGMQITSMFIL